MTALQLWIADHRHELDDVETAVAYGAGAGLLDGLAQQGITPQTLVVAMGTGIIRYLLALLTKQPTPGAPASILPPSPLLGGSATMAGPTNPQPPTPPGV